MMKRRFLLLTALAVVMAVAGVKAGGIEDIRQALERSSQGLVQEKVFLHTDNQCYFVGDTLWYKAYVVRADNLKPTDMSRILYVELLSPDGLLVERQQIVVSDKGYTCGQFALTDSLYSGYYELRAYTRWMLNFNVRHHRYTTQDAAWFYNKEMAADYFRVWDGLYSRVLPVYSKPQEPGNYDARRMYQRPKTRVPAPKKDNLVVTFYPEGGHLVQGVENHVAFDITDQHGEAVSIKGRVSAEGMADIPIETEYMGRGSFVVTPTDKRLKAHFTFRGKDYSVSLPKAEVQGIAIHLDGDRLTIHAKELPQDKEYALSILCRGKLQHFEKLSPVNCHLSTVTCQLSPITSHLSPLTSPLPTGVNNLTIFDSDGRIWADRLFFVDNHDRNDGMITAQINPTHTYAPYERVEVPVQLPVSEPTTFSLAIRDTNTDEPTYDNGNLMTDLLLSSELRGFIARPAYYFESDDAQHRRHLDLLMMVQGWRKYNWKELSDSARKVRYEPESSLTVEGTVYRMYPPNDVEPFETRAFPYNIGFKRYRADSLDEPVGSEMICQHIVNAIQTDLNLPENIIWDWLEYTDDDLGTNHKNLSKDVLVEAEIAIGDAFVGSTQKTKNGRFLFKVPPFYGGGYLKMKAYRENDSINKNMASRKDAKIVNEGAIPDYYVKRDLFYPRYAHEYTYYENHQPDYDAEMLIDTVSELSMENEVHELENVNVKGHRRGRRAIDWNKPAHVMDAYDLYNDVTDYGLSFGMLNMRLFPVQASRFLFGNMNRNVSSNIDGRLNGFTFYRNYCPMPPPSIRGFSSEAEESGFYSQAQQFASMRSPQAIMNDLKLKRLSDIRIYTDYVHRNEDSTMVTEQYSPDVTVELVPFDDDAVQPSFRDRHIYFMGFNQSVSFYQPDYSTRQVGGPDNESPADYRRTLYWNPNAVTDEQGRFTATFYNNGKETRIRMTAAGVTKDGRLLYDDTKNR